MVERAVVVRLRAEVADYKRAMKDAGVSTENLGKDADKTSKTTTTAFGRMADAAEENEKAYTLVGTGLLAIGAAAAVGIGLAVSKFADFDEAMSHVQAATHETTGNMDLLRDASMAAGADTQYSATEAAGAVEELSKAGVSAADILGGGLTGSLSLAAAGGLAVADAAEIAATALTMFNLEGSDVPHVADLLAAGAGKAQGSVEDMGMALKQAGLVANQTGLTLEETTGGLAAFASAGLVGSDAGTSFKAMLQRLTPQSAEARKVMDELGISAYDSSGQFVGLSTFAGNLQTSLKNLTPEARNAAMSVIFGSDAVRASSVLYEQGAAGINEWIKAVDDSGYAAETAALRTANLKGDLERLQGALDTALIQTGSNANGVLRGMTKALTETVDAYSSAPGPVQGTALALGGVTAAAGLLGGGFLVLAPRINETKDAIALLGETAPRTTSAMKFMGKAAGIAGVVYALGAAVAALGNAQAPTVAGVDLTTAALLDLEDQCNNSVDALFKFNQTGVIFGKATGGVEDMASAIESILGQQDPLENFFSGVFGYATEKSKSADQFEQIGQSLGTLVQSGDTRKARELFDDLYASVDQSKYSVEEFRDLMPGYGAALAAVANEQELGAGATAGGTAAIIEQVDALGDLITAQSEAAGVALSERDAQRGLEEAYDSATVALEKNGQTLDITTEAGRANQQALDDISSSGWSLIESMKANGSSQESIQGQMVTTRQRFIDASVGMGMSADEAGRVADQLGLIPANVTAKVSVSLNGYTETYQYLTNMQNKINTLNGTKIRIATGPGGQGGLTFADGGYTGDGGRMEPAGIVHKGEVVIKASSAKKFGVSNLLAINARGYAEGGLVGGGLSPGGAGGSMSGLAIEGTLDLGNGLVGMLRGVVKSELADTGARARYAGRS